MDAIFLKAFYPEIFLSFSILFQLIFNARIINSIQNKYPLINIEIFWQGIFILLCLFILETNQFLDIYTFRTLFVSDICTQSIKNFIVLITILCFVLVWKSFVLQNINFYEYFSLYFLSLLGILLLINTSDLISAYLVIELQALAFYILACFKRTSAFSTEAGLKYFILGSFISGLFLLGSFFLYAFIGSLNINDIALILSFPIDDSSMKMGILLGAILVTFSLLFKAAVVPFHFWAPDVYEGAPLSSTIIFSIIPKFSVFVFLMRWISLFINEFIFLKILLILSGVFSVLWGAYFAIIQKRIKRFIIYSSISQVGFIVVACSVCTIESYTAIFFYLIIYLISSIIIWGSLVCFYTFNKTILKFEGKLKLKPLFLADMASYFKVNYVWALMLLSVFFSFAGIPPLSGFLAKLFIIFGLIANEDLILSVVLIVISIISTYYYLRVIKIIFFDSFKYAGISKGLLTVPSYSLNIECTILSFCTFLLFFLFFYPTLLLVLLNAATYGCVLI
jgi:NADH-quinone oxidoreductase subunit N